MELIHLDQGNWEVGLRKVRSQDLLFPEASLRPEPWDRVREDLKTLNPLLAVGNLLVAGGRIFSTLFGSKSKRTDLFFYGCTNQEAELRIHELARILGAKEDSEPLQIKKIRNLIKVTRTKEYISFKLESIGKIEKVEELLEVKEYHLFLQIYSSPEALLDQIDLDSCALGYDGRSILLTPRALAALNNGYNTVDPSRMHPKYVQRLIKYATRGLSIRVHSFDRANIDQKRLEIIQFPVSGVLKRFSGLSLIIFAEFYFKQYDNHPAVIPHLLAKIKTPPIADHSSLIRDLIDHMIDIEDECPKKSEIYMPLLQGPEIKAYINFELPAGFNEMKYIRMSSPIEKFTSDSVQKLLQVDPDLYRAIGVMAEWVIPEKVAFTAPKIPQKISWTRGILYQE